MNVQNVPIFLIDERENVVCYTTCGKMHFLIIHSANTRLGASKTALQTRVKGFNFVRRP